MTVRNGFVVINITEDRVDGGRYFFCGKKFDGIPNGIHKQSAYLSLCQGEFIQKMERYVFDEARNVIFRLLSMHQLSL